MALSQITKSQSQKIQVEDPRFEKLKSERGSDGTRRLFVRVCLIASLEAANSTYAHRGGGIRMKVSDLDDAEVMGAGLQPFDLVQVWRFKLTCVILQFLSDDL